MNSELSGLTIEELQKRLSEEVSKTDKQDEEKKAKDLEAKKKDLEILFPAYEEIKKIVIDKKLRIGVFADHISSALSTKKEDEVELLRSFKRHFECETEDTYDMDIYSVESRKIDVYIIDYGGLTTGGLDDFVCDLTRELMKKAEDMPNTMFILGSNFTMREYCSMIEHEYGKELESLPFNVVFMDEFGNNNNWLQKVSSFFCV